MAQIKDKKSLKSRINICILPVNFVDQLIQRCQIYLIWIDNPDSPDQFEFHPFWNLGLIFAIHKSISSNSSTETRDVRTAAFSNQLTQRCQIYLIRIDNPNSIRIPQIRVPALILSNIWHK